MRRKLRAYALVSCLFLFLFVLIGGGLHLSPAGAFVAALSGTPLVIHVFRHWSNYGVAERRLATRLDPEARSRPRESETGSADVELQTLDER